MVKLSSEISLIIAMFILHLVYCEDNDSESQDLNFTELIMANSNAPLYADHCLLRIVGGKEADIKMVPYQVAMRRSTSNGFYWFTFCGGTIITMKFILAAAHCFILPEFDDYRENVRAVAGSVKSEVNVYTLLVEHWRKVKYYYYHEEFVATNMKNDIALLELDEPFMESEKVQPIRMHSRVTKTSMLAGTKCLISGYGRMLNNVRSTNLQMTCVPILPHANCTHYFGTAYFTRSVFCAGSTNKDCCEGDSGGPIVCGGVLVGIISWGGICGQHPGVYTRVYTYTSATSVPFVKIVNKFPTTEMVTDPEIIIDSSTRLSVQILVLVCSIIIHLLL